MQFSKLGVMTPILNALSDKGYTNATEIQVKAIPEVLAGRDLLACAQTGTGKTAAFAIPMIQGIEKQGQRKHRLVQSLILTPTRELAIQIDDNIRLYNKYTHIKHTAIFGGVSQHKQVKRLEKGVDLLVATPGRLLDLINQGYISLKDIRTLVLDEADRMLDMGFIHDIRKVIAMVPRKRQTLFFSATMPSNIRKLTKEILHKPVRLEAHVVSSPAQAVEQMKYYTNRSDKKKLLLHILKTADLDQVLLFTRTKRGADKIARELKKKSIHALPIHGDKSQNQRQRALDAFKKGKVSVLVATDIAARGIDIDKLDAVINFDVPNLPETYVHRIGRTGRAGEEGIAITLIEPEENIFMKDIEKLIDQRVPQIDDHPYPQTDKPMTAREKKEWNKEKARRKQEYHRQRRKKKAVAGRR